MKIQRIAVIASIIILLVVGWKFYRWNHPNYPARFAENIVRFQEQENKLNELVVMVMHEIEDGEIQLKILNMEDMSPLTQEKMQELGFQKVTVDRVTKPCSLKLTLSFEVSEDWNIDVLNNVQVTFAPCDEETRKGFHRSDGRHIDIYGQGKNWKIISDTDFI